MIGLGTVINSAAIVLGGAVGLLFGRLMKERLQETLTKACGVSVLFIGIAGAMEGMLSVSADGLRSGQALMVVLCLALGALAGEIIDIEARFARFGEWLKRKTGNAKDKGFADGFVTASLTVCFAEYYNDTYDYGIEKELLTAGAVLHDIGKVREYGFDSTGAAMRPTDAMKENAHAMEGAMMIREMAQELGTPEDKAKKLANLVASHHTAYPFRVGVSPITPEAKLLAVVDNLDSSVSSNFGKGVTFMDGKPVHIQDVA